MAGNPPRFQMPGEGDPDPSRSRFGSFPMQPPGPEEFSRLQELLAQALKREAEAHRKVKHLHEQLIEVQARSPRTRSISDGSQSGTPDILWDSELSQTSEGSPHSPPPAVIVVSDSPACVRKSPSLPGKLSTTNGTPQLVGKFFPAPTSRGQLSNGGLYGPLPAGESSADIPPPDQGIAESQVRLAPSPQDYRGVIHEREKPPPSLSPAVQTTPTSLTTPGAHVGPERPPSPRQASPPPALISPESSLPIGFSESVRKDRESQQDSSRSHGRNSLPADSILRSTSIKEKRKTKMGPRSRSNTGNLLSNWMRRKRGGTDRPPSPSRTSQRYPVDSITDMFEGFVRATNISSQQDTLSMYLDHHWSEVCVENSCSPDTRKYRDAVWDLFQMEAKFLIRFLQPLERVYKGFLEELHFHGILKVADVDKIFANLSELCELSSSVAMDLFHLFDGRSGQRIAPNKELILAFSMFGHKFNPVYQRFCVNFEKQRGFVRALEKLPDFVDYLQVCRQHQTVGKNDLSALLIAPMQHQCHYQLALEKVLKYTKDKAEKELLSSAIKAFVLSLKELEANIAENKRSAEMLELQETLCWPSLSELDPTAYIPESMSSQLSRQPCSYVLASKDRQLVYNSPVKLMDKKTSRDAVAFLFTDSLLLTQQKSSQAEKKNVKKEVCDQLTRYCVLDHPLLLTMLDIHDIPPHPNHTHLITLVEKNLFQQRVAIYSLQLPTKEDKVKWLSHLQHTQNMISYRNSPSYRESDV